MKILNQSQFDGILEFTHDGNFIYIILNTKNGISIISLEPLSLSEIKTINIARFLHPISNACIDHSSVYLPLDMEEIIAIDKFSGDIYFQTFTNSSIIFSDILQNDDYIYYLSGIPISHKYSINTDSFCMCAHSKKDGKLLKQSQSFRGSQIQISFSGKDFYITADKDLYKFNSDFLLENTINLAVSSIFKPLITNTFVIMPSERGTLEIINKDTLSLHKRWLIEKNEFAPICYKNNIYWISGKNIRLIDLNKNNITTIAKINNNLASDIVLYKNNICGMDDQGNLFKFNIHSTEIEYLKISNKNFWCPLALDKNIILLSEDNIIYTVNPNA